MSEWIKQNLTFSAIWKIMGAGVAALIFIVAMDAKVNTVENTQVDHIQDYQQFRYQTVPENYMRKDVMEQVLIRLERIERKIDQKNEE